MLDFVRYFLTSKNHLISSTFKSPSRAPAARSTTTRPGYYSVLIVARVARDPIRYFLESLIRLAIEVYNKTGIKLVSWLFSTAYGNPMYIYTSNCVSID